MNRVLIPRDLPPHRPEPGHPAVVLRGRCMGTDWSVQLCGDLPAADLLQREVQGLLDRLEAQMSHWSADSDLGVFNRRAPGSWQPLPDDLFEVLQAALALAQDTDGAIDPTLGALVNLWGFGPAPRRSSPPSPADIAQARARCGWQRLQLDPATRRARQPGGLELDLSCIAKGHAVDRVAERLLSLGLAHFLVEVGGELRGQGCKADGSPWWVELEGIASNRPRALVALHGLSVATSGDYRQFFEHAGRRYAHTLDPRLAQPLSGAPTAVSVLHPSCRTADAAATALCVLGADAGLAYADTRDLAAVFLLRDAQGLEQERWSRAATALLE